MRLATLGTVPAGILYDATNAFGFSLTRNEIEVTSASVVLTEIGTTEPFSAISGASSLTLSEGSAVLPYSALMASASLFALNASIGYLSLAAANAGARPNGMLPRPTRATAPAPCRIRRRVAENPLSVVVI